MGDDEEDKLIDIEDDQNRPPKVHWIYKGGRWKVEGGRYSRGYEYENGGYDALEAYGWQMRRKRQG